MSATAFQLRRRQAAAAHIVTRLGTAALRTKFIKATSLVCADASAGALYEAIAAYTDPPALLALADEIDTPRRRRPRRRTTETTT